MLPFGLARVVAGLVFALGLALVLLAGAQIFTGDVLMVMAWASGKLAVPRILRAWALVWIGNLARGASAPRCWCCWQGTTCSAAARSASWRCAPPRPRPRCRSVAAFILGVLCNTLVCLAVWLSLSSRLPAHRLIVVVLPIAAFVAAGFEHAVANMYFLAFGLLIKCFAADGFWQAVRLDATAYPHLGIGGATRNLAAVTIGNVLGGAVFVAGVYWLLYRRPRERR